MALRSYACSKPGILPRFPQGYMQVRGSLVRLMSCDKLADNGAASNVQKETDRRESYRLVRRKQEIPLAVLYDASKLGFLAARILGI